MRHQRTINHLGRTSTHRKAMLSNMAASLILHKRIKTTVAKAKALRGYVEPLINRAKEDTTANRRHVFSHLQNKEAVSELFREISQKILERPGGYTRILKTGTRLGDRAEMCFIELVDYNQTYLTAADKKAKAKGTRRGPRKKTAKETAEEAAPVAAEAPAEEKPKKTRKPSAKADKQVHDEPAPEAEGDAKAGE